MLQRHREHSATAMVQENFINQARLMMQIQKEITNFCANEVRGVADTHALY